MVKDKTFSSTNNLNSARMLGLDILKIVSTFLIIAHHLSKHGAFFEYANPANKIILSIINALFLPSVNVFVFISAYLINKKGKVSFKNYLKLYAQIIFYTMLTYAFACLLSYQRFSIETLIKNFMPIVHPVFWFAKAYLIMYLISPLLLKITQNLEKKEYQITILVILGILLICSLFKNISILPLDKGFNAIWFAIIFIFAGYQARFGLPFKKSTHLIIFIASSIFAFFIIMENKMAVDYTHIVVVMQTLSIFNLMYNIKTNNKSISNTITFISTCTFGIYLLHDGKYIQLNLYKNIFRTYNYYSNPNALLYFFIFSIIVFISGVIIEVVRKLSLKLIKFVFWKIKENK